MKIWDWKRTFILFQFYFSNTTFDIVVTGNVRTFYGDFVCLSYSKGYYVKIKEIAVVWRDNFTDRKPSCIFLKNLDKYQKSSATRNLSVTKFLHSDHSRWKFCAPRWAEIDIIKPVESHSSRSETLPLTV